MIITGERMVPPPLPPPKDSTLHVVRQHPVQVGMARVEDPPPYALDPDEAHARHVRPAFPSPTPSSSLTQYGNANLTNHLYIKTRHDPINGVYRIDPELESAALDRGRVASFDKRHFNRKHQRARRPRARKGFWKRVERPMPNAIFETRQGAVALDLAVVAGAQPSRSHALVQAATRQGSVDINVLSIHPRRHLNMEVSTRQGHIHLLIPRSFSGYIQLYSRHGALNFLPNIASVTRVVYHRENETQVVVGEAINSLPAEGSEWDGDIIHASSRSGNIIIGYVGEDTVPPPEKGFWKKLGDHLFSS